MASWPRSSSVLALTLALVVAPAATGHAQTVALGVRGGVAVPELRGGDSPQTQGYTSRLAPNFGVFLNAGFTPDLSFRFDLAYAGQGGKKSGLQEITAPPDLPVPQGTTLYADFDNKAVLEYLEGSFLGRYGRNVTARTRVYLDVGPYVGYLLRARTLTSGTSTIYLDAAGTTPLTIQGQPLPPQDFGGETEITSDIKRWNAGLAAGFGLTREAGPGRIVVELHGTYGLVDIQRDPANGTNNTGALVVSGGYEIFLRRGA